MELLWMGSGWWSVAGLILDAAGVIILFVDLLPEYRLNRLARKVLTLHARAVENIEKGVDALTEAMMGPAVHVAARDGPGAAEARSAVDQYRAEAQRMADAQIRDILNNASGTIDGLGASELWVRPRPRLFLAGVFLVTGFALQAWGAIPIEPQVPEMRWVGWLG